MKDDLERLLNYICAASSIMGCSYALIHADNIRPQYQHLATVLTLILIMTALFFLKKIFKS